jgi:hypothetical protein
LSAGGILFNEAGTSIEDVGGVTASGVATAGAIGNPMVAPWGKLKSECLAGPFQVFISHFTGEPCRCDPFSKQEIARIFQEFIQEAFLGIQVFRSSDDDSIGTGERQYGAILDALETTKVLIALLSRQRRYWSPFFRPNLRSDRG